jgi:hypothetical protein
MALDDLNLEFEDEEEGKRKKNDALAVDVDLEFQSPSGTDRSQKMSAPARPEMKAPPVKPSSPGPQAPSRPVSNVKNIDDARANQNAGEVKRPAMNSAAPQMPRSQASQPRVMGSSALQDDSQFESQELLAAREQVKKVEFESSVKVAVAEFKTELLSELNGDIKLMEHQINQLLIRINAKNPELKPEVLAIKKILTDFTAKKRK